MHDFNEAASIAGSLLECIGSSSVQHLEDKGPSAAALPQRGKRSGHLLFDRDDIADTALQKRSA